MTTQRFVAAFLCLAATAAAICQAATPAAAAPPVATAASAPAVDWAYPPVPPLPPLDDTVQRQVPGSERRYTQRQVEDDFNAPDWHPEDHPAPPPVVAQGRRPAVRACMKCHLTNGGGHPESSDLDGLSVAYIRLQMQAFRDGGRTGGRAATMIPIAREATEEELAEAGRYFAALPPVPKGWREVVEVDAVPQTRIGIGGMRYPLDGVGTEALGLRIIEVPQHPEQSELRDSRGGFISYVPRGSLARGKLLVETGGGTVACASCHGAKLAGNDPALAALGEVPPITGRSPLYMFRQMNDFKTDHRKGATESPMRAVVAQLDVADMIAVSAYLATLQR
jgi:cytochrome c553